ncbi:MAG TPA: type 2 isopentenyl-diphosphate Delta-isomerase [Candidatus Saccharimonadales bacterium]|nr:type 2 isopentenyl-diphosphate Delta-isomerase [Candidatus Saccharimonadales bacterium]
MLLNATADSSTDANTGSRTASRKDEHLRINIDEDVAAKGVETGFDDWRFVHRALPEIDLDDVELRASLLGRHVGAPLLVSCMTGGTERARIINERLARVAQAHGLAMGLGSCRVLLEQPDVLPTFDVRELAPDVLLLANLGAVQLNLGVGIDECRHLLRVLRADALVLHLNPLQEALQTSGNTNFSGLLGRIAALCAGLRAPVIVKEVGWGIADDLVTRLFDAGVAAVDIAGAGGTSWSEVERHRMSDRARARIAAAFAGWGIPTAAALILARGAAPAGVLIASGGVRNGIDIAKALTLGADSVGIAGPLVRAAAAGDDALDETVTVILEELRLAMFCVGAATVGDLRVGARLIRCDGPAL